MNTSRHIQSSRNKYEKQSEEMRAWQKKEEEPFPNYAHVHMVHVRRWERVNSLASFFTRIVRAYRSLQCTSSHRFDFSFHQFSIFNHTTAFIIHLSACSLIMLAHKHTHIRFICTKIGFCRFEIISTRSGSIVRIPVQYVLLFFISLALWFVVVSMHDECKNDSFASNGISIVWQLVYDVSTEHQQMNAYSCQRKLINAPKLNHPESIETIQIENTFIHHSLSLCAPNDFFLKIGFLLLFSYAKLFVFPIQRSIIWVFAL